MIRSRRPLTSLTWEITLALILKCVLPSSSHPGHTLTAWVLGVCAAVMLSVLNAMWFEAQEYAGDGAGR